MCMHALCDNDPFWFVVVTVFRSILNFAVYNITCPLPLLWVYTLLPIPKFVYGDNAVNRLAVYVTVMVFCTAIKVDESEMRTE